MARQVYITNQNLNNLSKDEIEKSWKGLSDEQRKVFKFFKRYLSEEWTIFIKPYLNSLEPDFILLNDERGVVIVKIGTKNSEDNSESIESENLIEAEIDESFDEPLKEAPEIRHLDLIDKEIRNVFCPSGYNTNFRTSRARLGDFQGTERPNSFFKDFNKRVFLPFTTCIIASPNLTKTEIEKEFPYLGRKAASGRKYWRYLHKEMFLPSYKPNEEFKSVIEEVIPSLGFKEGLRKKTLKKIADELRLWLLPDKEILNPENNPYAFQLLTEFKLDLDQEVDAKTRTKTGLRKIRGAAGSGKTLTLAYRAIELLIENKKTLFITKNRSLIPYILSCVFRVLKFHKTFFLTKKRGQIKYDHFYSFIDKVEQALGVEGSMRYLHVFRSKLSEEKLSEEKQREKEKDWGKRFRKLILEVKKQNPDIFEPLIFDSILVDELQDWNKHEWLIVKEFLSENSEMVAAGDSTQDLYSSDASRDFKDLKGYGLPAKWLDLRTTHRLPKKYSKFMSKFLEEFLPHKEVLHPQRTSLDLNLEETSFKWTQVEDFYESQKKCIEIIKEYKRTNRLNRLLFLADSNISGTMTLFNLIEQKILTFDELIHTFPFEIRGLMQYQKQYPKNPIKNWELQDWNETLLEMDYFRKKNRSGFFIHQNGFKASTTHHFKGLESSEILFEIAPPDEKEKDDLEKYFSRIYTGLTRLSKGIEIQESGVAHSCIQVVCSEPMFLEYSKSWKDLEIDKLLDF